jgi:flagellar biosynthetic protein FliR
MFSIIDFTQTQIEIFLLVLLRVGGILFVAPIFGHKSVPAILKIGFSLILALILVPLVKFNSASLPDSFFSLTLVLGREVACGLLIGFLLLLIFIGVQMAGFLVGLQMGFGIVNIFDPNSQTQISVIGQFKFLIAMLFFLAINGHHILISAIFESFRIIPLGQVNFSPLAIDKIIQMFAQVFAIAIKIEAPVLVTLFLTDVAMAIVARTIPQMNIFIVGFPVKIGVGLFVLAFSLPVFGMILEKLFLGWETNLNQLLHFMR